MVLGPDGAMYVCDWRTNSGGMAAAGDGKHGRIYRVTWAGTAEVAALPLRSMDSWAKVQRLTDEELIKVLASEEFSDRLRVPASWLAAGRRIAKPARAGAGQ